MTLSLIRYPGGKTRAASKIVDHFPFKKPKEIFSPFFGGGSVEFLLASKGCNIKGYDNFNSLVCFWNYVKSHPYELSILIEKYYPLTKEEFNNLQNRLIELEVNKVSNIEVATIFYVLNRTSFSGTTLSGGFSPDHPRFNIESIKRLKTFQGMKNISIEYMDFEESFDLNKDNWVYCDPPYYLEKNKANLYGIKGNLHRYFNHQKLYNILKSRDRWVLSYNDCKFIRDLYKDFIIKPLEWKYGLGEKKESSEIIITPK